MKPESYKRIIKLGLINFRRNSWLSFTATLIMALTLIIISVFAILNIVIDKANTNIREKMDISVYLKDTAQTEQIVDLQRQLTARGDVKEAKYISKEDALAIFQQQQKGKKVAESVNLDENPLPRSLEIKSVAAENLDQIAQFVGQDEFKPIIENISFRENKKIIDRLIGYTSLMKWTGWIFSIVFVVISILVILNTIRLAIFTRKDEIEIMRLVGANNIFIRVPFIVEGFLYGVIAAVTATVIIKIGVVFISRLTEKFLEASTSQRIADFFSAHFLEIFGLQLLVGVIVGISCSLFSIRKHLKV